MEARDVSRAATVTSTSLIDFLPVLHTSYRSERTSMAKKVRSPNEWNRAFQLRFQRALPLLAI